jgi:hypothetical protein
MRAAHWMLDLFTDDSRIRRLFFPTSFGLSMFALGGRLVRVYSCMSRG